MPPCYPLGGTGNGSTVLAPGLKCTLLLCNSQTLPFLNIWRDLSKEFASVNPD